ncbi:hypothetical protein OG883_03770 [Streptomyces sp. NBC_01142]|uniref:hypothetical protein n=1 Tax=Streptomyces sp. NBC_01142 TaxID=2975865 RepID=UPI00225B5157|nr:hypothetical protein [Streptomyces sp. NBC_01142]MCX4819035.1 hypothetical protein [Streptomyces sp. NBC_01142]
MSAVNFEELNNLTGEMLPERAVLSAFGLGGDYGFEGGNGGPNGAIVSTCTASSGSPLLIAGLPVGSYYSSVTCTPSTVAF